jgi:hypothetical protein
MNTHTIILEASAVEKAFSEFSRTLAGLTDRLSPKLIRQILQLALDVFEDTTNLRYVQVGDCSAPTGDLRICLEPGEPILGFLAAVRALDRDLGVFE